MCPILKYRDLLLSPNKVHNARIIQHLTMNLRLSSHNSLEEIKRWKFGATNNIQKTQKSYQILINYKKTFYKLCDKIGYLKYKYTVY